VQEEEVKELDVEKNHVFSFAASRIKIARSVVLV
jgi:hypothetical protein